MQRGDVRKAELIGPRGFQTVKCKGKGKVKMNGYLGVSGCGDAFQGYGKHDQDMGMMSSVLGLMSLKCYRDLEFGRAIGIEITDAENVHLKKVAGAERGNRNTQADRTEGQTENRDQESKKRDLCFVTEDEAKSEEAELETN